MSDKTHIFPAVASIVDDIRSDAGKAPGAIELRAIDGDIWGIGFRCPCGCGEESWLPLEPRNPHGWTWDGNREAPTLEPSVLQSGLPCKWHGFLRNGEWVLA